MIPENITLLLRGLEESVCLSKVFIELLGCIGEFWNAGLCQQTRVHMQP